jgi:superkiller protein 3
MAHAARSLIAAIFVIAPLPASYATAGLSGTTDSLIQAGVQMYGEGRYEEAIRTLRRAAEDTLTARCGFYLGCSYALMNDFGNARKYYRTATTLEPSQVGYRYQFAQFLAQSGLRDDAERQYEQILHEDSTYLPALHSLGLISYDLRDYRRCAALFSRAIAQNTRDYLGYYYLGSCAAEQARNDSARALLSTCLSLNPNYTPALVLLASLYYKKADFDEALRHYAIAKDQQPENADLWYHMGLCQEKLDAYGQAARSFRMASALDSSNSLCYAHLGQAYFHLRQYDSAIAAYTSAAQIDEDNPTILINIALAWTQLDSLRQALGAFDRCVAAYHPEKIARVYLQTGAIHFNRGRYREARTAYRKALQYDPAVPEAQFYLALTNEQLHDYQSALVGYRTFMKLASSDTTQRQRTTIARERIASLRARR